MMRSRHPVGCCARAATDHAAEPPRSVMHLRRFISDIGVSSNRLAPAVRRFAASSACLRAEVRFFAVNRGRVLNRGRAAARPDPESAGGFPLKPTCNLRAWNTNYRQSLRIQRERGFPEEGSYRAWLICVECVKQFTHGGEALVGGWFHDRRAPCPTHTTCSAAIFARVATSPDAMKEISFRQRTDVFCRSEIPSRFVTAARQSIGIKTQRRSSTRSSGGNKTSFVSTTWCVYS
jgi:hypothetical protein